MAIVNDAYIKALLKTVYLKGVYNNKYQNSPILHDIAKESWEGGKEIKYAAQYGNGGNFGSNYGLIANNQTTGVRNLEWSMEPGYVFGLFNIDQPEILSSADERGAYMKALENKMAGAFDGLSKTLALYLYGGKAGVIDKVKEGFTLASTGNTIKITSAGAIKLDLGSRFVIASEGADNTATPTSALLNAVCTVTGIDDETITFNASAAGETVYVGDYIELYSARTGNTFTGIEGLADIIPTFGNRTGTAWENYIKTDFRGVDRSQAVSRLAGQFVKAGSTGDTRLSDALVSLLKKTKRAGGVNDIIVINDETFANVAKEIDYQKMQGTNGSTAEKQRFTAGLNNLGVAFEDAFINRTVVDPYCTEQVAYMFDKEDLKLFDMGNVSKVLDKVANDSLGKPEIEGTGDAGIGDVVESKINFDKLFTVMPNGNASADNIFGPSMTVSANIYANFMLRRTASAGAAVLE